MRLGSRYKEVYSGEERGRFRHCCRVRIIALLFLYLSTLRLPITRCTELLRSYKTIVEPPSSFERHSKMRAARYYGKEDVRIEHDVPSPPQQLGEGQVRVRPAFVGICGTGMDAYLTQELIDP
jgi:hypothetical protein